MPSVISALFILFLAAADAVRAAIPYGQNLLVNGSASAPISTGWTVLANGGAGWARTASGGYDSQGGQFSTSYALCSRSQTVDLIALGATPQELDAAPPVTVSEAISSFLNAGVQDSYYIRVELRNAAGGVIASWNAGTATALKQTSGSWVVEAFRFENYGPGLRTIYIEDGGRDEGNWSGNYGTYHDAAHVEFASSPAAVTPGELDLVIAPNPNSNMTCALSQPDGAQVMLGNFTIFAGNSRSFAARMSGAGVLDPGFTANGTAAGISSPGFYCGAVQPDGKIVVAGLYTAVNGAARQDIARVNPNGSVDTGFAAHAGNQIRGMAMQPDGRIVLAGYFTTMNGINRNRIARLNADGTLDSLFNPSANDIARTVALQLDGKMVIGGSFTSVSGVSRPYLARVNADGTLDSAFNTAVGGAVYSAAIQPDGKMVIGGTFTAVGGVSRSNLARINANGSLDTGFNPGTNGNVRSSILQADGKIIIGGEFTTVAGASRQRIARLNADGTLDAAFNASANATVYGVTLQADGKVGVSGEFSVANGVARANFARLLNDPATQSLQAVNAGRAEWLRGGSLPEATAVTLQFSSNGGGSWSPVFAGTRISGGWAFTGFSLPQAGLLRARARTAGGYNNGAGGLVEMTAAYALPTAVESWRLANFGSSSNAGIGANTADPDKDGLDNLSEFAFGLDPLVEDTTEMPEWQKSGSNYVMELFQPLEVSGISYIAEYSSTLEPGSWTSVPNTGALPRLLFTVPESPGSRQFLRLRITEP